MQLTNEEYNVLLSWAERNLTPIKSINEEVCAYTIHGIFERLYDKGFYVTEHDVIRAMKDNVMGKPISTFPVDPERFKYFALLSEFRQRIANLNGCRFPFLDHPGIAD